MLRRKGGRHKYSIIALAILFIINLIQTGEFVLNGAALNDGAFTDSSTVVSIMRGYSLFITQGDRAMYYWYWDIGSTALTIIQE